MCIRNYILILLTLFAFLPACESNIVTEFSEPIKFSGDQYCEQRSTSDKPDIPEDILEILYDDNKPVNESLVANAILVKAAIEIAHASSSVLDCKAVFAQGNDLFVSVLKGQQNALGGLGSFRPAKDPAILSIQTEITRHWRDDQSSRGTYLGLKTEDKNNAKFWAQRLATAHVTLADSRSRLYIDSVLKDYDWIDNKRFGDVISDHAWVVVQHADDFPEFQQLVLKRMEPYLKSNAIKPSNYAYLWDRVAVNTGKKQRYGTQPKWECENGELELQPLEDPEFVNQRRAKMKMDTVEKALARMAISVCG